MKNKSEKKIKLFLQTRRKFGSSSSKCTYLNRLNLINVKYNNKFNKIIIIYQTIIIIIINFEKNKLNL